MDSTYQAYRKTSACATCYLDSATRPPPHDCKRHHPVTEVSKEGAESLFKQIEPGLKRVGDKSKRQRTE